MPWRESCLIVPSNSEAARRHAPVPSRLALNRGDSLPPSMAAMCGGHVHGVAKRAEAEAEADVLKERYMAPEVLRREQAVFSSDIW